MDELRWDDVQLFLAIAESGSLSGAARTLGLGQPTVTRRLADLEHRVGGSLFRRAVAGATLTDFGARLLEPARRMAEWAGEARRQLAADRSGPSGLVRISASPMAAAHLLAPFAGVLARERSALRLEVNASVRYVDLVRGEAELALRMGGAPAGDMALVGAWTMANAVFAAPDLAARLRPMPPLSAVPFVAWAPPFEAVPPNPQLAALIPGFLPAFTADDYLVQVAAARAGAGAIVLARARAFANLGLVPLDVALPEPHVTSTVQLVCAPSALAIPRVRAMAGRLGEALDDMLAPADVFG